MTQEQLLKRLEKPKGPVDVVLDTDTFNEIDDQYALSYLLRSPERLRLQAVYAAPFWNEKSTGPEDGMEKSYREILNVLHLLGEDRYIPQVLKGSRQYLEGEDKPAEAPAARDLVRRALGQPEDSPLYVVAIGAITNVASALLMEPAIREKIVVVWLGGHAYSWPDTKEFNMQQDVAAARVVFGCGVPLVQLPCMGVVSAFAATGPELEHWLRGKNALCDYLADLTAREAEACGMGPCWSRVIWDVTAVAWLTGDFMEDCLTPSPIPQYDHRYSFDPTRHFIRYVYHIRRDKLMEDLFRKLAK
ncbi:MAG TPA: nucleoside hydrolase [Candidatus Caccousia avistercoris]|nr:nucleoside hydrolase [Candidatus Caccousia avistercoris]